MHKWWAGAVAVFKEVITPTVIFGWLVTSVVVAIAGPFGTFETQPIGWRLAYWSSVIGVAIPIAFTCRLFWRQIIKGEPSWLEDFLVIGSLALIFGPLVVAFNVWLTGAEGYDSFGWPIAALVTFFVGIGIVTLRRWMQQSTAAMPAEQQRVRDRLLDRIGAKDGVRLVRVSSDNHHIRVITDDGEEYRTLMRLRDAIAEIDVEPGLCVHRSHWVALTKIVGIEADNGKEVVRLSCGQQLPVGPKYRPDLINHGVLAA